MKWLMRLAASLLLCAWGHAVVAQELLAPLATQQFFDNNGVLCVGCKLFTYAAGTTTKQNTYTDAGGGTPNTNPIILDARGDGNVWLTPGLSYKFVLSPSTDTDPPTNPFWTVDNIVSGAAGAFPGATAPHVAAFGGALGLQDLGTSTNNVTLTNLSNPSLGLEAINLNFPASAIRSGLQTTYTAMTVYGTVTGDNGALANDLSGGLGLYVNMADATGITSGQRGQLFGASLNVAPSFARSHSPYDDATALIIDNAGTATGTEGIFLGHLGGTTTDWINAIGINASASIGIAFEGAQTMIYGIDFGVGQNMVYTGAPMRLANNTEIVERNAANTQDTGLIGMDASDKVTVGLNASALTLSPATITMAALPTSAGSGGLVVCVDNTGVLYKKSSCP